MTAAALLRRPVRVWVVAGGGVTASAPWSGPAVVSCSIVSGLSLRLSGQGVALGVVSKVRCALGRAAISSCAKKDVRQSCTRLAERLVADRLRTVSLGAHKLVMHH